VGVALAAVSGRATLADPPRLRLRDVAREAGLDFVHQNGPADQVLTLRESP